MEPPQNPAFSDWLVQRQLSHHTVRLYERWAERFHAFAAQSGHALPEAAHHTTRWESLIEQFLSAFHSTKGRIAMNLRQVHAALRYYREYLQSGKPGADRRSEVRSSIGSPCRIVLFGGLRVTVGDRVITRFASAKTGALLAYLVLFRHHGHAREELVERLWPEVPSEVGRNRLKQCLCSLRRQLEPPGVPYGSLLIASKSEIALRAEGVVTDVADFEAALKAAGMAASSEERLAGLERAVACYGGELLPRQDGDWVLAERERLTQSYLDALRQLAAAYEQVGDLSHALTFARKAVEADPLCEECHCDVMRLLAALGQPSALNMQYRRLKQILTAELGVLPSQATRDCVKVYRQQARAVFREQGHKPHFRMEDSPLSEGAPAPPPSGAHADTRKQEKEESGHDVGVGALKAIEPRIPLSFTRFFGREQEMALLTAWVCAAENRLVTLTGLGGCGKTRLALEVARRCVEAFAGAVWFVALADLTDARLILTHLTESLDLRGPEVASPLDQVAQALAGRRSLLVLDNFEHLVEAGAPILRALLERAPGLKCLVTSRQRLELEAERELMLSPLPIPDGSETSERLSEFSSVQLFRDRAQALQPDFQITPRNAATVAALCRALEGLPLAIELAAAWIQTLAPRQMLERLEKRFRLLATQWKDIAPRHRTLWATLEASYRLLIPELQRFFRRLSVFRGGWTLEAAEQVCETPEAWEYLAQLRIRSLVVAIATEDGREMRFRMLETLREYAYEKLTLEEQCVVAEHHAANCLQIVEQAAPELVGQNAGEWLNRLEREQDNLRAALRWTLTQGQPEVGLKLAGALWRFWYLRGDPEEGLTWLRAHLERGQAVDVPLRIKALHGAGNIAFSRNDYASARGFFETALALRDAHPDPRGIAASLGSLANIAHAEEDYTRARDLFEQALAVFQQTNDTRGIALSLANLALVAVYQQDYVGACALHRQSLELFRAREDLPDIALALNNLIDTLLVMREISEAQLLIEESLLRNKALRNKWGIAHSLTNLITLFVAQERFHPAAVLIGATDALREQHSLSLSPLAKEQHTRQREIARANLSEATFADAYAEGVAMVWEQALRFAQACLGLPEEGKSVPEPVHSSIKSPDLPAHRIEVKQA